MALVVRRVVLLKPGARVERCPGQRHAAVLCCVEHLLEIHDTQRVHLCGCFCDGWR